MKKNSQHIQLLSKFLVVIVLLGNVVLWDSLHINPVEAKTGTESQGLFAQQDDADTQADTESASEDDSDSDSGGINPFLIGGGIVAVLVVLGIVFFVMRRSRKPKPTRAVTSAKIYESTLIVPKVAPPESVGASPSTNQSVSSQNFKTEIRMAPPSPPMREESGGKAEATEVFTQPTPPILDDQSDRETEMYDPYEDDLSLTEVFTRVPMPDELEDEEPQNTYIEDKEPETLQTEIFTRPTMPNEPEDEEPESPIIEDEEPETQQTAVFARPPMPAEELDKLEEDEPEPAYDKADELEAPTMHAEEPLPVSPKIAADHTRVFPRPPMPEEIEADEAKNEEADEELTMSEVTSFEESEPEPEPELEPSKQPPAEEEVQAFKTVVMSEEDIRAMRRLDGVEVVGIVNLYQDDHLVATYQLDNDGLTIGRASDNQIVILDTRVSGNHAILQVTDGTVSIKNLSKTNIISVRGTKVEYNESATLSSREIVRFTPEVHFQYLSREDTNLNDDFHSSGDSNQSFDAGLTML